MKPDRWTLVVTGSVLVLVLAFSSARGEKPGAGEPKLPNPFGQTPAAAERQSANLGPKVNSKAADFGPIIAPDGNALFFTSDRPGGLGGQDVWVVSRVNGVWQKAQNLGAPINTPGDEGPDCFSLSENALYFTACDREFGQGKCDIYASFKIKDKWSTPENLGPPINTKDNASNASISSNGDFIIFTSDRPGGLGGADLWISHRGEMIHKLLPGFSTAGRWEEPVNLGPHINTPDWDGVGFLMPDNQTLYFSSRGRGGAGGADIFRSVLKNGAWSPAENMGDIINTPGDDVYFTLPGSGDLAYFSSDMSGSLGQQDIYSIPIPLLIPKSQLVVVRGRVKDAATDRPLSASVKVIDPATAQKVMEVSSNPKTGEFQVVVQLERIRLVIAIPNYAAYEETFEVSPDQAMAMVTKEIKLSQK